MFADRTDAGKALAEKLSGYGRKNTIVLAIPRGGVAVGYVVAKALSLPLDVIVVKKLGAPGNSELAIGAAGADDFFLNDDVIEAVAADLPYIQSIIKKKEEEARTALAELRGDRPMYDVSGNTVLLVDDGIATGATIKMAIRLLRKRNPEKIVVAVPVAPPDIIPVLRRIADDVVVLEQPGSFSAVGEVYHSFPQVGTDEARRMLLEA